MRSACYAPLGSPNCLTHRTDRHACARLALALALTVCSRAAAQPVAGSITVTHSVPIAGSVIDAAGNIYYAGSGGPTTPGAAQGQAGGGNCSVTFPEPCPDAYVGKADAAGNLVFGTLLGGPTADTATALAVDPAGNVYITGTTGGSFPTTANAAISASTSSTVFAAKVSADGSRFIYSTYLASTAATARGIAFDGQGNAYIVGTTNLGHAYAMKLSADGSAFLYQVTLSGSKQEAAISVVADATGDAVVVGSTSSSDFPVSVGVVQSQLAGTQNLFLTKLDPSGRILFSTYLGGSGADVPRAAQMDPAGNVYILGGTNSLDFPTTQGAFQTAPLVPLWNTSPGGFIAKVTEDGSALVYSSYVMVWDQAYGGYAALTVSASGEAYLAGTTMAGFPVTESAPQPCFSGTQDVYVAHLAAQGALLDATYVGLPPYASYVNGLGLAEDGTVLLVWHTSGPSTFSRIRFGDPGWTAPSCLSPAVLNAAALYESQGPTPGGVAPGEFISLTGLGIGPELGAAYQPGAEGQVPLETAGVQVLFDGQAAPVLYAQSRQVNTQAPYALSGQATTVMTLIYNGVMFGPLTLPVASNNTAQGIFRQQPGISTQAVAFNADGTLNGAGNPASPGSVVTLWGTGFGPTDPSCPIGNVPAPLCGFAQIEMAVPSTAAPGPLLMNIIPGPNGTFIFIDPSSVSISVK